MDTTNANISNIAANGTTLASLALQIAQGQVGQTEQPAGSNSGPMVNEYLKAAGLKPGYAWCQAFVYWCYNEAAKQMGAANPVIKTAGVYDCWNRTKPNSRVTKLLKALVTKQGSGLLPGDQFIMTFGRLAGHTGLVERVVSKPDGTMELHTIEGNSNNDGSRDGYAVVRHVRHLTDKALQGFIRYV